MAGASGYTVGADLDQARAEPFDVGRVQWVRRAGDGERPALSAGYWFVSPNDAPDPFEAVSETEETIHIVEGHLTVQPEGGTAIELHAGSCLSINRGVRARWTVRKPTVEFFVYT